jgi:hypothetical protein
MARRMAQTITETRRSQIVTDQPKFCGQCGAPLTPGCSFAASVGSGLQAGRNPGRAQGRPRLGAAAVQSPAEWSPVARARAGRRLPPLPTSPTWRLGYAPPAATRASCSQQAPPKKRRAVRRRQHLHAHHRHPGGAGVDLFGLRGPWLVAAPATRPWCSTSICRTIRGGRVQQHSHYNSPPGGKYSRALQRQRLRPRGCPKGI